MITVRMGRFETARINHPVLNLAASTLADRLAASGVNAVKLALVQRGKVATANTLRSVRWRAGLFTPGVVSAGHRREVVADRSWENIVSGRRAGAKMPIRVSAQRGKRGGKLFEPLPRMVAYFEAMGIPKNQWFPIMRRFSMRGIMPRPVHHDAHKILKRSVRLHMEAVKPILQRGLLIKNA
jgi:hypothetical protein